jgi:hypothetical protein
MGVDMGEAVSLAVVHTVLTDVLGHERRGFYVRRASYHDGLSLFFGFAVAFIMQNPVYLWLGAIHVILDWLSPGKLGVSYLYSLIWASIPALILYIYGVRL